VEFGSSLLSQYLKFDDTYQGHISVSLLSRCQIRIYYRENNIFFFILMFLDGHYGEAGIEIISKKLVVICLFPFTCSKELIINQITEISIITCQARI